MNLSHEELEELNQLLSNKELDLPSLRRKVTPNGMNYHWLQRNISIRNHELDPRLAELLHLDRHKHAAKLHPHQESALEEVAQDTSFRLDIPAGAGKGLTPGAEITLATAAKGKGRSRLHVQVGDAGFEPSEEQVSDLRGDFTNAKRSTE